jgi:hypothetical protein
MKIVNRVMMIVLVSFGLSGCGATKPQIDIQAPKQPQWYTHPPQSDTTTLYGVGDGVDKNGALKDALNNVLGSLSLSLSSEYDAKTVVQEGLRESSSGVYKTHIYAKVQQVRITNYEVLQTQKLGFKHYATLVKVDKKRFYQTLKNELEQKFHMVKQQEKNLAQQSVLKRFFFYKKVLASLDTLPNTLLVMDALNPQQDTKMFLQQYVALKQKYDDALSRVVFDVIAKQHATFLVPVVKEGLTKEHFKVAQHRKKNHICTLSL